MLKCALLAMPHAHPKPWLNLLQEPLLIQRMKLKPKLRPNLSHRSLHNPRPSLRLNPKPSLQFKQLLSLRFRLWPSQLSKR